MPSIAYLFAGLLVLVILRLVLRGFFKRIGAAALAKQPEKIHLQHRLDHRWKNSVAVDTIAARLLDRGFADAGTFTILELPVAVRMFAKPDEAICATIYEHPKVGVWMDMYTRHEDETGLTFATTRDTGLDQRPGRPIVHLPGVDAGVVYERFVRERPDKPRVRITAEELPEFYEQSYAEQMAWRRNKGVSATEVARVAEKRSHR